MVTMAVFLAPQSNPSMHGGCPVLNHRMLKNLSLGCALAAMFCACASGPPSPQVQRPTTPSPAPARVTEQNYRTVERKLRRATPQSADFLELRAGLVRYLVAEGQQQLAADDYPGLVDLVSKLVHLHSAEEIEQGALPPELSDLSKRLLQLGEAQADEGAVLGALRLLQAMHPDDGEFKAYYDRLREWGTSAREILPSPIWMDSDSLKVWKRHAELSPTPEVLSAYAQQHMQQRARLIRRLRMAEGRFALSAQEFELVQHKAFEIAGVFLRRGDLASALSHLRTLAMAGPSDSALVDFLERALKDGKDGADALAGLADTRSYGHRDPEVAQALCELGTRAYPHDTRFLHCLGSLAALQDDVGGTIEAYEQAIARDSTDMRLRDAYQLDLFRLLSEGPPEADPGRTDRIASHLIAAVQGRLADWPDDPPTISPAKLYIAVSMSQMNAGQADKAEQRLRESLTLEESPGARSQLANLLYRLNRGREAATHYEAALSLVAAEEGSDSLNERAELRERIGDAKRMTGAQQDASASYRVALTHWDALVPMLTGAQVGLANIRRGVLLGRLGNREESQAAFKSALSQAPGLEETYKRILSHLVVADADVELAEHVFHHAQNQLDLEPQWKVYLALWLKLVATRAGRQVPEEAAHLLQDASGRKQWWSRLAAFGANKLTFDQLVEQSSNLGERAEAMFYEGARRLQSGDAAGARSLFEQVLATNLVNFYEYIMAQELLTLPILAPSAGAGPGLPVAPAVTTVTAAP